MFRQEAAISCGIEQVSGLRTRKRGKALVKEFVDAISDPDYYGAPALRFGVVIFSDRWNSGRSAGARLAKALEEAYPGSIDVSRRIMNPNHNSHIRLWTFHIPKSLREEVAKTLAKKKAKGIYW